MRHLTTASALLAQNLRGDLPKTIIYNYGATVAPTAFAHNHNLSPLARSDRTAWL